MLGSTKEYAKRGRDEKPGLNWLLIGSNWKTHQEVFSLSPLSRTRHSRGVFCMKWCIPIWRNTCVQPRHNALVVSLGVRCPPPVPSLTGLLWFPLVLLLLLPWAVKVAAQMPTARSLGVMVQSLRGWQSSCHWHGIIWNLKGCGPQAFSTCFCWPKETWSLLAGMYLTNPPLTNLWIAISWRFSLDSSINLWSYPFQSKNLDYIRIFR